MRDINRRLIKEAIIIIRRLLSKNVLITFKGLKVKEKWKKSPKVLKAFKIKVRIRTLEYIIIIYNIRVLVINIVN